MSRKNLNIVFMGTPEFAVGALDAIKAAGHNIVAVYSQPPRPAGRGHKLQPSPVHRRGMELGIPVHTPLSLKKDASARATFKKHNADVAVVAAYGLILPQEVLDAPTYGCLNIHASLLPRWRGASPIQRAILAGDSETGVCIMRMDAGLDTGPVLLRDKIAITQKTTASSLHDDLSRLGAGLIVKTLEKIETLNAKPQPEEGMTYAPLLTKDDGRIDWTKSAREIERQLRALTPWPGVWCMYKDQRLKVLVAEIHDGAGQPGEIIDRHFIVACGKEALLLKKIQPQDRKPMDGLSFMNGTHATIGEKLS